MAHASALPGFPTRLVIPPHVPNSYSWGDAHAYPSLHEGPPHRVASMNRVGSRIPVLTVSMAHASALPGFPTGLSHLRMSPSISAPGECPKTYLLSTRDPSSGGRPTGKAEVSYRGRVLRYLILPTSTLSSLALPYGLRRHLTMFTARAYPTGRRWPHEASSRLIKGFRGSNGT